MAKRKATTKTKKKTTTTKKRTTKSSAKKTNVTKVVATKKPKNKFKVKKINNSENIKIFALEAIGTFVLATSFLLVRGTAFFMIFVGIAVILGLGVYKGGHLNPLLSFGAWINKKISAKNMLVRIIAQLVGAMLAFVLLNWFIKAAPEAGQQAQMLGPQAPSLPVLKDTIIKGKEWFMLVAELLGAIVFGLFVAKSKTTNLTTKAITYGSAMFVALLLTGSLLQFTGGGMAVVNPAIALALQPFSGKDWVWVSAIYLVFPLIGGGLGYALARLKSEK